MVETGIQRTPTEDEKRDFKSLGNKDGKRTFLGKLADTEMEFVRKHMPFDAQNAKLDFQDMIEDAEKESERNFGFVREQDVTGLNFGDLRKYGDASRFEKIQEDTENEMVVVNGQRASIKTGVTIKYKTKVRGFGVSVFLPNEIYEERFGKKKSADGKKD